ncbi:IS4 family transposase, partial [Shigella flexneri]|nr:IS4 family transposase [Shigella flexneri]
AFPRLSLAGYPALFPLVFLVCLLVLACHLLSAAAFGSLLFSVFVLAVLLFVLSGVFSLSFLVIGYFSLGLFFGWSLAGVLRLWLFPL